jgi:hypothetical protein
MDHVLLLKSDRIILFLHFENYVGHMIQKWQEQSGQEQLELYMVKIK